MGEPFTLQDVRTLPHYYYFLTPLRLPQYQDAHRRSSTSGAGEGRMRGAEATVSNRAIGLSSAENKPQDRARTGFVLAIIANLIWGSSFLASKTTLEFWGPFTASALRFTIAIGAMLLFFPLLKRSINIPKTSQAWGRIFLVGLTGFGFLYPLQLKGLTEIPSSLSASIMLTSPLFVLLLATGLMKEPLSVNKMVAIALGITGGVLLVNPINADVQTWGTDALTHLLKGSSLTLLASVSLAGSVLATKSASRDMDTYSLTFWSMVIGLVLLLPFAAFETGPATADGNLIAALSALLYLALICSVVAFLIWNHAITLAPPQNLASPMHIKTPVAVLIGISLGKEPLSLSIIFGTILVSIAVWISQSSPRLPASKKER